MSTFMMEAATLEAIKKTESHQDDTVQVFWIQCCDYRKFVGEARK